MEDIINGIGQRIRDLRKRRGLTLQDLGGLTNLSTSYLSQIENGKVNLTLDTLLSIASELDVPLIDLVADRASEQMAVVRATERKSYPLAGGGMEHLLFGKTYTSLQVAIIELPPHGSYPHFDRHPGEEFTYVLSGKAQILLGESQSEELGPGDVVYYRSTVPHRWINLSEEVLCLMVVNTPASL